jgi:hypothetical protein
VLTLRYTLQCARREGELPDSCWPRHIGIADSVMTHRVARPPQMHRCLLCPYFIDPNMIAVPLLYNQNTVMQGISKICSGCKVLCRGASLATASVASLTTTWCGSLYDFLFVLVCSCNYCNIAFFLSCNNFHTFFFSSLLKLLLLLLLLLLLH